MTEVAKVVHAEDVEMLTNDGWRISEVLGHASEVYKESTQTRQAGSDSQTGMWREAEYRWDVLTLVRPLFVMRKDSEIVSREQQLEAHITALNNELGVLVERVRDLEKEREVYNKVKHDLAELKVTAELERDRALRVAKDLREENEIHNKLLNLIRKEIGEAKWRELEGSHTSCVHCIARQP